MSARVTGSEIPRAAWAHMSCARPLAKGHSLPARRSAPVEADALSLIVVRVQHPRPPGDMNGSLDEVRERTLWSGAGPERELWPPLLGVSVWLMSPSPADATRTR
jgi:hypothetical protein